LRGHLCDSTAFLFDAAGWMVINFQATGVSETRVFRPGNRSPMATNVVLVVLGVAVVIIRFAICLLRPFTFKTDRRKTSHRPTHT